MLAAPNLMGCGGSLAAAALPDKPKQAAQTEFATLLLFPSEDAAALLGRQVKVTSDGSYSIADRRAPGCEVRARRIASTFRSTREIDLAKMTSVSASYAELLRVQGKYGQASRVAIDVENTAVLEADTRGSCGDVIIERVFVGRGTRNILRSADMSGSVEGTSGALFGSAHGTDNAKIVDGMSWPTEQAYGFTFGQAASTSSLELEMIMPVRLVEGEELSVRFRTNRPAYIVVYYLDDAGRGAVLWPTVEEPAPLCRPDTPAVLPSPAQTAAGVSLEATLSQPGTAARETLVAYAFADRADFDRFAPHVGESNLDGAKLAAALTEELSDVPLRNWARSIARYEIAPKPAP
jgi:hypothetical protein